MKTIINHKWQCECGVWIGEDYDECPLCQQKKIIEEIKQKKHKEKYQIKNECASCGKKFNNNKKNFEERGNFCLDCSIKCEAKLKWRKIKEGKKYWEELLLKANLSDGKIAIRTGKNKKIITTSQIQKKIKEKEKKLKKQTQQIMKRWKIDMEEDNKRFQGFKNYLWKVFTFND